MKTSLPVATPAIRGVSRLSALVLCAGAALAGCAGFGPEHAPLASSTASTLGLADAGSAPLAPRWWTSLNDPRLNQLVEQALQGSPTLAVARARLERASTLARISRAAASPQPASTAPQSENTSMAPRSFATGPASEAPSAVAMDPRSRGTRSPESGEIDPRRSVANISTSVPSDEGSRL